MGLEHQPGIAYWSSFADFVKLSDKNWLFKLDGYHLTPQPLCTAVIVRIAFKVRIVRQY